MEKITARSNEKIKYARSLADSASKRRQSGEFLLEGARLCADAAVSGVEIVRAFFTAAALSAYPEYIRAVEKVCPECYEIGNEAAGKLSDTGTTQGVFCVCRMKNHTAGICEGGRYLALENIQDPSNTGAICRSAEALGLDGLIVSGGCDIYNPKALRAAMGSSLRINILICENLASFIDKNSGFLSLAAVPDANAKDIRTVSADGRGIICCVGNEGNGLSDAVKSACDEIITIPMQGRAESLNASAAAAILAWELKR